MEEEESVLPVFSSRWETLLTANELINLDHHQQQARQDVKNNFLCVTSKINHRYFINHKSKPKSRALLVVQVSSTCESSRSICRRIEGRFDSRRLWATRGTDKAAFPVTWGEAYISGWLAVLPATRWCIFLTAEIGRGGLISAGCRWEGAVLVLTCRSPVWCLEQRLIITVSF